MQLLAHFQEKIPPCLPGLHVNGSVLEHLLSYRYLGVLVPLTSLDLTILLRLSAQKHENRLDYYTVVL